MYIVYFVFCLFCRGMLMYSGVCWSIDGPEFGYTGLLQTVRKMFREEGGARSFFAPWSMRIS